MSSEQQQNNDTRIELVKVNPMALDAPGARSVQEVLYIKARVGEILEHVLKGPCESNRNGIHYGPAFPGSDKHTLKLPGALTLCSTFGLTPRLEVEDLTDNERRVARYRTKVRMFTRSGMFLGEGIGECSTDEDKYQWQEALNESHWQLIKHDNPRDARIKYTRDNSAPDGLGKILQVRTNYADKANTVLKMSKKRALVDAVILVLDCSDLFDQDLEELIEDIHDAEWRDTTLDERKAEPKPKQDPKPKPKPVVKLPNFGQAPGKSINDPSVTIEQLTDYAQTIERNIGKPGKERFVETDKAIVASIKAEIALRQRGQKKTDAKPAQAQAATPAQDKPSDQRPQSSGEQAAQPIHLTPEAWEAFVTEYATSQFDLMTKVKDEYGIMAASELPEADRPAFFARFQELLMASNT